MIFLFNFFIVFSFFFNVQAFDVRVLLEKFNLANTKKVDCTISSQHGMMISGIDHPILGVVTISCTDKEFMINGTVITDDTLTITPVLPDHHDKQITHFVDQLMRQDHDFFELQFMQLAPFYEKFVNDRDLRDYSGLYATMQRCVDHAITTFIDGVEHPVISYESLQKIAQEQIVIQLKILLTSAIYEKKASKNLLQQIKIDAKIRNDFFVTILQQVLAEFLTQYFKGLPHKILHQAIKEETGCLLFNKHKYLGSFYLVRDGSNILLINSLDIDDYLLSVVHSEGWPGWPMEVNKALVVASRTYLVDKILQANKVHRPYHIINSIKHQTYKGHHKFVQLKQAVDQTRNIFISYKNEPIVAMFDSCCGGVIPAKIEGYDFNKCPYLARTKLCTHCKRYWIYDWKKEFSSLELAEILGQDNPSIQDVCDMKVTKKDPAGLVKQVLVTTKKNNFYISGKKIYSLFPSVKSFCYTIKKKGKGYVFQGRGFGHHMGLCQWGSRGMVQDNWNYQKILQFYYPGTELMKLTLSR